MTTITLAFDDDTADQCHAYVQRHHTTLDALVRDLLLKAVLADCDAAVREMFRLMDVYPGRAVGKGQTREDLYS